MRVTSFDTVRTVDVDPPIDDGSGYRVRDSDLAFLGISPNDLADFRKRLCPLGMTIRRFEQFVDSLETAIEREALTTYDLRLKGSSAEFFSGHHKKMVWTRSDVLKLFRKEQERLPERSELDEILATLFEVWPDNCRPTRRPFDALYIARLLPDPSDYDVQIAADELVSRAHDKVMELGEDPNDLTVKSSTYDFVRKDIIERVCPHLRQWMLTQRSVLRRLVTIAVFPSAGPTDKSSTAGPLSAHFRSTDWMLLSKAASRG